jgi:hypothetical protein
MPLAGVSVSILSMGALAIWPSGLPLWLVIGILALAGFGIGTVFPVATVSVQNAVARGALGTATGAMNFFRSLGSALVVALLGAIVLGGIGGGAGVSLDVLARSAASVDLANVFRFVFLAAALVLAFALAFLIAMEERVLRGPAAKEPAPASTGPITPQPAE